MGRLDYQVCNHRKKGGVSMINKPTKEQFEEYVAIRDSGVTNMFDIKCIIRLSETGLKKEHCIYIMQHFADLADEYEVEI